MRFACAILVFLLFSVSLAAQTNGGPVQPKPASQKKSPGTAALLSAILPGAGQVYNGKTWWWKLPIIYGAGAGFTYGLIFYHREYKDYRDAYRYRIGTGSTTNGIEKFDRYQTPTLRAIRDSYRDARDQCGIGLLIVYTLQIVDASVEAHLLEFNINDDLSLKVDPVTLPFGNNLYAGVQFKLLLK